MTADVLLAIIAGRDTEGFYEVRWSVPGGMGQRWHSLSQRAACIRFIESKAHKTDVFVGAAPRRVRGEGGKNWIDHAWCLWVDCDTPEALDRLHQFTPWPSLIIRSGTGDNVHAYWQLSTPLPPAWLERANRRLAHCLGADMKSTDVARIMRPPGSLNHKHDPPGKVTVEHHLTGSYPVAALVGNLSDPPNQRPTRQAHKWANVDSDDPLQGISAPHYYTTLTGLELTPGNVRCPFHKDGRERSPSMRLYETTYMCFGCDQGGSIYEFGARLWGYSLPLRGDDFKAVKERLTDALG